MISIIYTNKKIMKYKSIFISDVHLGTNDSKSKEVIEFLKDNQCDNLFLLGDIIDGWQIKKGSKWKKKDTKFFRFILKLILKRTKVIYIRGNHDDFLDEIIPFAFHEKFSIRQDYIYKSNDKSYYLCHGDVFDNITSKMVWLSKLGDIGYNLLLRFNRWYNKRRIKKGLEYHSISQEIKSKVKVAVEFLFDFEKKCVEFTKHKKCDGIICGHVHIPAIKEIDGITYYNSGDWVETMSALVEDYNGDFSLFYYQPKEHIKQ